MEKHEPTKIELAAYLAQAATAISKLDQMTKDATYEASSETLNEYPTATHYALLVAQQLKCEQCLEELEGVIVDYKEGTKPRNQENEPKQDTTQTPE